MRERNDHDAGEISAEDDPDAKARFRKHDMLARIAAVLDRPIEAFYEPEDCAQKPAGRPAPDGQ